LKILTELKKKRCMRLYDSFNGGICYSCYSTILVYNLNERQLAVLNKCIENIEVNDRSKGKEKIKLIYPKFS